MMSQSAPEDAKKAKVLDDYFDELFKTKMSAESKSNIYKLRLQTLLDEKNTDPKAAEKALKVADIIAKEEDEELRNLSIAVKATALMKMAEKDKTKVDDVFKFADEIMAGKPTDSQKEQVVGMKVQAYLLKAQSEPKAYDDLLAYLDKTLAEKPKESLYNQLAEIKIQLLLHQLKKEAVKIEDAEKAVDAFAGVKGLEETVGTAKAVIAMFKVENLAKNNGKISDLNAVLADIKKYVEKDPSMVALLMQMKDSINKIGEANKDPELLTKVYTEFAEFCKKSDKEELKSAAKPLEDVLKMASLKGSELSFEGILAGAEKDKKFNTSSLKGKVILVDLWSSSNQEYFETLDGLKKLSLCYKDKDFAIVGVNFDQDMRIVSQIVKALELDWPLVSEKMTKDAKMTLPETLSPAADGSKIIIGKDGKVVLVSNKMEEIEAKLVELLGKPVIKEEKVEPKAEAKEAPAK